MDEDFARSIVQTARQLRSEAGENPEYDRALAEMACDLIGVGVDYLWLVRLAVLG